MCTTRFSLGHARACRMSCCIFLLTAVSARAGGVLYVDAGATGAGDGSSWCDAYVHLQDALTVASLTNSGVSEIRVAQGVYKPDQGAGQTAGNRDAVFTLGGGPGFDNVAVMGGYAGCGSATPDARDVALYETVLSGDLLGNDGPDFANYEDNSYHVVRYLNPELENVVLDGFTISGGNANGTATGFRNQGSAIHIRNSNACMAGGPTIRHCIIEKNWAAHHGAINDHATNTVIEHCTFRDNYAGHEGGGLQIHNGSTTVINSKFLNNKSGGEGGGVWMGTDDNWSCTGPTTPVFLDCTFEGNEALKGGGMFNKGSSPTLERCTFRNNAAINDPAVELSGTAAGFYNLEGVGVTVKDCLFTENNVATYSGAMYNEMSNPTITGTRFERNEPVGALGFSFGAAMLNFRASPRIEDCVFKDNTAHYAAGILNDGELEGGSNPLIINTLFEGNVSVLASAAIFNANGSSPTILSSVFRNNHAEHGGAIHNVSGAAPLIVNSLFAGNTASQHGGAVSVTSSNTIVRVINSTFTGNVAAVNGGGLAQVFQNGGQVQIHNSIFWDNSDSTGSGESAQLSISNGILEVHHTIVQGWTGLRGGSENSGSDPQFVNAVGPDGVYGTADDNLRLSDGSPAVDAGENGELPQDLYDLDGDGDTSEPIPFDLDGTFRISGPSVDMGAFEFCQETYHLYADVNSDQTVNFTDVSLILDVFRGTPTSIEFEDGDIAPCGGDGNVNFGDVSAAVDAFRGMPPCPNVCL
jgi:hypothetical protein